MDCPPILEHNGMWPHISTPRGYALQSRMCALAVLLFTRRRYAEAREEQKGNKTTHRSPGQVDTSREELVDRRIPFLVLLQHLESGRSAQNRQVHGPGGSKEQTFATANSKSSCVTCCLRSRSAYIPASVQIPRTSAPEHWPIFSANARRLMPRCSDICDACEP